MEGPTEKVQRYDRQLRLWGDHGQALLESSKICLINATATGCEILKNLILPGVGSFTIIDDSTVTEQDLGTNFFLTSDSLNQKRGQAACEYLKELNEDVEGNFLDEKVDNLLKKSPCIFLSYNLVIVTSLSQSVLLELDSLLYKNRIPLLVCRSYGMIGYLRLVVKEHTVVEAHPEHAHPDLRLTQPFPELERYCDSIDLEKLDKKQHSHIPWLVIIFKFLQQYKRQNDGELPLTYKDKKVLKDMILRGVRCNEFGISEDEENFDEAARAVNTALIKLSMSDSLKTILEHPNTTNITTESKSFWVMCRALKDFVDANGSLPLQGSIPDMTADSESYITLQQVYKDKAAEHIQQMNCNITAIKQSLQSTEPLAWPEHLIVVNPTEQISLEEVRVFCQNAAHLSMTNCRSLEEEHNPSTANNSLLSSRLDADVEEDNSVYYILLRAADEFHETYSRFPGNYNDQVEADIPLLKAILQKILQDINVSIREDYIHEMCSYGAAELHAVASFMGGVASQEAIKLITRQYVPINNTFIYNACTQTSTTLDV